MQAEAWIYQERGRVLRIFLLTLPNDTVPLGLSYTPRYQPTDFSDFALTKQKDNSCTLIEVEESEDLNSYKLSVLCRLMQ